MSDISTSSLRARPTRVFSPFEFWPGWLFYTPVVAYWLLLGLRYRDMTLATAANPCVESGGLCGESKSGILDQVTGEERQWIAPYIKVRVGTHYIEDILGLIARRCLAFPLVLKPDIGCHGDGVQLVENRHALADALGEFSPGVDLLIQEFIQHEAEAGIFYVKLPGSSACITSLTLKFVPFVTGDGKSNLKSLIEREERTGKVSYLYMKRLMNRLHEVIPSGQKVKLVFTGNHCKGSIFKNGGDQITPALIQRIDGICSSMPHFHFGRIDLRFRDLHALRNGEDFRIIEINGVGSEATHIWDPKTTLMSAYRDQFKHYRTAFEIGDILRKRGYKSMPISALLRLWRVQGQLMAGYPPSD